MCRSLRAGVGSWRAVGGRAHSKADFLFGLSSSPFASEMHDRVGSNARSNDLPNSASRENVMNTKYKIVLAVVAGAALGAAAVQGLHAQAKPKAYLISETE